MSDYDPRAIDLYDEENPDGPDHDFYRSLANRGAKRILDLGCGTGILTVTFAIEGRDVVGIDPSAAMLNFAKRRPGADAVHWVLGDSSVIPGDGFDLAVMTGNVAQHIPAGAWETTLADVHAALRPGGTLAFETRNPAARAWEGWNLVAEPRDTEHGTIIERMTAELSSDVVTLHTEMEFVDTGEVVRDEQQLVFRMLDDVTAALVAAGFTVESIAGDWLGTPFAGTEQVMVVTATA